MKQVHGNKCNLPFGKKVQRQKIPGAVNSFSNIILNVFIYQVCKKMCYSVPGLYT